MKKNYSGQTWIAAVLGIIPAVYFGLLFAPYASGGLPSLIMNGASAMKRPLDITICDDTPRTVGVFLILYLVIVLVAFSSDHNYRDGAEHGSSKWDTPRALNSRYSDKNRMNNKILTQNVAISLDPHRHMRNLNVLVCGGSGSGKTRFYAKPNILSANTSLIILDPKAELVRSTGRLLEQSGYKIKILDLIDMTRSDGYNPFMYLKDDNDIQRMVTNLFNSTTPKEAKSSDAFWDQAAMMLLTALVMYLHYECPPEDQNFSKVLDLIRLGGIDEDNSAAQSKLDMLFNDLAKKNPEHGALKYYRNYRSGAGKTLKSIQLTLITKLEKFNLSTLSSITKYDEMELDRIGEEKTALFAVIPDNDTSFNFIVGMLYTQLFQQLYYCADVKHGGKLPVHVHFVMDEFANIAIPDDFDKLLATMRSREISVSIIIQNLAQLKKLFPKEWESITGNCDEFLYLGGNEQSTFEYVSKLLGKETLESVTYSKSGGNRGNYSMSNHLTGRELLMPDEVRMMSNRDAILFIRGERPVIDKKYDIMKHPNVSKTADGGGEIYLYGQDTESVGEIFYSGRYDREEREIEAIDVGFYSSEEMERLLSGDNVHV